MIPIDAALDAFINANILIIVAFGLWNLARVLLRQAGLKHAYSTELKLLNGVFLAIIFAPFLIVGLSASSMNGITPAVNFNFSDMVVSHYLNGGFEMKASEFERLLMLRNTFTQNVVNMAGWVAWAAIAVFLIGLAIGSVRLFYSVFCLRKIVVQSYAWRRFGRLVIRLSDNTHVPFSTRGIRNYYIVLPSEMLTERNELTVSLAHELQHIRRGDIEWEILLEALKPFFFLNPAYHAWKRQVEDLRELSCDSEVLSRGSIGIKDYCETLFAVCQNTLRKDRTFAIAVPKVTLVTADRSVIRKPKVSFLEQRVTSLLDANHLRHPNLVFGAIVIPLVAVILLTAVAIQRPGDWSQDRLMLSTVVNLERLDEINRLSTFGRIRN